MVNILDQSGAPLMQETLTDPGAQYCFTLEETEGLTALQFQILALQGGTFTIDNLQLTATCTQGVQVANVKSAQDYYPFGSTMPGRVFNSGEYRFGFNGKEMDDEVKGAGNSLDYVARIYDPRVGRWLSLDPEAQKYPQYSDYSFITNSPLSFIDPTGTIVEPADNLTSNEKERVMAAIKLSSEKVPNLYNYLNTLRYHKASGTFINAPGEGASPEEKQRYSEAFDVIIKVGVKDVDGTPRFKEMAPKPSGSTTVINDPKSHKGAVTDPGDGLGFAGIKNNGDGTYSTIKKGDREFVEINSPDQFKNVETYARYNFVEGEVHFEIFLDDFTGSTDADGKNTTHEFGHVEGMLMDVINNFYFDKIYDGEDLGNHEPGNLAGENANKRTKEHEEAD